MAYAVIQNGVVVNIVEAAPDFAAAQGWVKLTGAGIGWTYDGSTFSPPPPPQPEVPAEVARRQILTALGILGWITEAEAEAALATGARPAVVDAVIAQMPEGDQFGARMKWIGFQKAYRDDDMVAALALATSRTGADIDHLFIIADTVK